MSLLMVLSQRFHIRKQSIRVEQRKKKETQTQTHRVLK